MEVYLDNSATTKVLDEVKDIMIQTMVEDYGNPSSMHLKGVNAEKYIKEAKDIIAKSIKAQPKEIFFTSGGTESNNMAIIGSAMANKRSGNHIITTLIEHPSVSNTMKYMEEQGFRVTYLPVDAEGIVKLDELEDAICDDTILVSIMYVNNEIGSVQPIEQISGIIKRKKPDVLFHVDAIQAFGKYRIVPKKLGIDIMSVSSHKIHGPKGMGFVYIKDKVKMKPIIFGGGQQKAMRSGTENVPGIAGLGVAVKKVYENFDEKLSNMIKLKDYFIDELNKMQDVMVNSQKGDAGAPHIISAGFKGIRSEVLLHSLEDKGIYVSAGSACASNKPAVSQTLLSIGLDKDLLDCTIRFSMCEFTTIEEIDYCINALNDLLCKLRLYIRH